jgi:pilus assembly protein CpaF
MSFELILPFLRPIEPLLLDESISETMGNPDDPWWYERDGIIHRKKTISFAAGKLRTGLQANQLGKRLDEDSPLLNAQLPDGSGLAAVITPVVRPSPSLTIRKFTSRHSTVDDLIARGTRTRPLAEFLSEQIRSGKTLPSVAEPAAAKPCFCGYWLTSFRSGIASLLSSGTPPSFTSKNRTSSRWNARPTRSRPTSRSTTPFEVRSPQETGPDHHGRSAWHRGPDAARFLAQTTFSDTKAEIGEAVDLVVHIERQPGRRMLREVRGYDRDAKLFLIAPVFEAQRGEPRPVGLQKDCLISLP